MHVSQERHLQVLRLGPRVSGAGYQVQGRVPGEMQILNLYPNLNT
jgi:hypothetical protein